MGKVAIEFVNVSKKFPNSNKYAVLGASAVIEEGSFVTILGTSGSGKTTLLKMVNRINEATSGEILFYGENINNVPIELHRRKIGYVIQQIGLFPHMTVGENIATVPKILKWEKQKINERVDYLLQLINLPPEEFKGRYPKQLSGGQQQRVGLARAMAANPQVMLMDEPFGAIDAITRQNLQDELLRIQKQLNKTILFVTHDINEAFKLGDKVMIVNEGKIEQYDTPYNILINPANEFVAKFISSEDILKRLKVVRAENVMLPADYNIKGKSISVNIQENLNSILTIFLEREIDYVSVMNDSDQLVGKITIEQLKLNKVEGEINNFDKEGWGA